MSLSALLLAAALAAAPTPAPAGSTAAAPLPTPLFRSYGVTDGLPSSNVYVAAQDKQGFIWLGTRSGLARFDGIDFKVFHHDPRDPASLPNNDISSIVVDGAGHVWVGGEGTGINRYDPATGGFRHWMHDPGNPDSPAGDDIMAMAVGRDGSIWASAYGTGVDHLQANGHVEHLRHDDADPHSLASDTVLSLMSDDAGRLWIGSPLGLDLRDASGRLTHVHFEGARRPPVVWGIDGKKGDIRISTCCGLYRMGADGVARRLEGKGLPDRHLASSLRAHGRLWIATRVGLDMVDGDGGHRAFHAQPMVRGGFPGSDVWRASADREGGLWFATADGGLGYLGPDWTGFTHFSHVPEQPDSLTSDRVLGIAGDGRGGLLVTGADGQLDRLHPATGKVDHLGTRLGIGHIAVSAAAQDAQGALWVGYRGGLLKLQDGKVTTGASKRLAGIGFVVMDGEGHPMVSSGSRRVLRVDPNDLSVTPIEPARKDSSDLETQQLIMRRGVLWQATRAGMSTLAKGGDRFVAMEGVPDGVINMFAFDGDDGLWVDRPETLEHYVIRADGSARQDAVVDVSDGLPSTEVVGMIGDARGRVWLASENGLWRYDPATDDFHAYGRADGMPSPEFTTVRMVRLADGTVYAGTLGGVLGFRPDAQVDHPRPPQMALTSISVRRNGTVQALPTDGTALRLGWRDRELRVGVRALSYIDPSRNHYRFRLVGFDRGWVDTGTRGEREFAGLVAGDYTLQVQAAGPSGAWASLETPLNVHVAAPPWATPWAWLAYALLALGLAWLAMGLWKRRVEQRHRVALAEQQRLLAEEANAAKTRFLATLGHEIRTPMTGVLGMAELLLRSPLEARQKGYAQAIQRSGALLLKLVNDALDLARIEAGRFELDTAPLDPRALLRDIEQLETGLAMRKGLYFRVGCSDDVPARVIGDALRIKQVLLNLANNALKFTETGGVRLDVQADGAELLFRVADTGPGIPEASRARLFQRFEQAQGPQRQAGSGLGLAICRELVALMGGRIELESQVGRGSMFEVRLPLPPVHSAEAAAPTTAGALAAARQLLLVEDDATIAEVICGLLQAQGHSIVRASNGLAALTELEEGDFDAMFLDLDLPGVDGFRVAQMVREREGDGHLAIIAITARSGGDEEARARAAGMDGFLRKPLSGEQLAAALAGVLERDDLPT